LILHTIVPHDIVFYSEDDHQTKLEEINYHGITMLVIHVASNEYIVQRIISTSLDDFLNPEIQPGSRIKVN